MTLDDLVTLICKLGLDQPRPIALWFVDRDAEYYQVLTEADKDLLEPLSYPLRICGIPLRHFTRSIATEEEYAAHPFFCRVPGIWIEMSDGNHVVVGEIKSEWIRERGEELLQAGTKEERQRVIEAIVHSIFTDLALIEGGEEPLGIVGGPEWSCADVEETPCTLEPIQCSPITDVLDADKS